MNNNLEISLAEWGDSLCTAIDNGEIDKSLGFEPFAKYVIKRYYDNPEQYQNSVKKLFDDMNYVGITVLPERGGEEDLDMILLAYYQEHMDNVDSSDDTPIL